MSPPTKLSESDSLQNGSPNEQFVAPLNAYTSHVSLFLIVPLTFEKPLTKHFGVFMFGVLRSIAQDYPLTDPAPARGFTDNCLGKHRAHPTIVVRRAL